MMNAVRHKDPRRRASARRIGFITLISLAAGLWLHRLAVRNAAEPVKPVPQLIRELQAQDAALDRGWQRVWPLLPRWARDFLDVWEPVPAARVRTEAARELSNRPSETLPAVPALAQALKDTEVRVVELALEALWNAGPPAQSALPELFACFDSFTRGTAAMPRQAAQALAAVAPNDPKVKQVLTRALMETKSDPAKLDVATAAVEGLGLLATEENGIVPLLLDAIKESLPRIQGHIIHVLAGRGLRSDLVVPVLISRLRSGDGNSDAYTLRAQMDLGPKAAAAAPALISWAEEVCAEVRARFQASPEKAEAVVNSMPYREGMPDSQVLLGLMIIQTLERIGSGAREAVPFLAREYSDPASPFRLASARARWRIDGATDEVLPVFLESLKRLPGNRRPAILEDLAEIGEPAFPSLVEALTDEDSDIRVSALSVIARVNPMLLTREPVLSIALEDSNTTIRYNTIEALGELGAKARPVLPRLQTMLSDPKSVVRLAAQGALEKIRAEAGER